MEKIDKRRKYTLDLSPFYEDTHEKFYWLGFLSADGNVCSDKPSVRMELKDSGVDVLCICPGDVRTNFSKNRVKTFDTNFRYGNKIEESAKQIDKREPKRMTIEYATKKMYKIANKKKSKPMYIIGDSMKWAYFANRIFPLKWILGFTGKYF